jgi:hypothetical protein
VLGKVRFAGFETAQDDVAVAGVERFALPGMALLSWMSVRQLFFAAGIKRRKGGEAAHAEHDIDIMLADDLAAALSCPATGL